MASQEQFQMSPADLRHLRAIRARRKFRAVVHLLIANLHWLKDMEDEKLGDNVKKNIRVLTWRRGEKSILTKLEKIMLHKEASSRTDSEKASLRNLLGQLKYFKRFPSHVKDQLPGIVRFACYGPNRVIVKQGQDAHRMYLILTGEVMVSRTFYDRLLKRYVTQNVHVFGPQNAFGYVALLDGTTRFVTVTTTEPTEILYIELDDFNRVLRSTITSQIAEIIENLASFPYFKLWNADDLRLTSFVARKKFYRTDQVILTSAESEPDWAYFVTKGHCYLVEHMFIRTEYRNGIPRYYLEQDLEETDNRLPEMIYRDLKKLYAKSEFQMDLSKLNHSLRSAVSTTRATLKPSYAMPFTKMHFMKICTFKKMACFNVGENMKNRMVVAGTDTECIILPIHLLLEKCPTILRQIQDFLKVTTPTTEQVFKNFLEEQKWSLYKRKVVNDILTHKKVTTNNCIYNVPYTIRLQEDLGDI